MAIIPNKGSNIAKATNAEDQENENTAPHNKSKIVPSNLLNATENVAILPMHAAASLHILSNKFELKEKTKDNKNLSTEVAKASNNHEATSDALALPVRQGDLTSDCATRVFSTEELLK